MKPLVSIIIPTWNNPQFLTPCIKSIADIGVLDGLCELIIVNNGDQPIDEVAKFMPNTRVFKPGSNLGWEGGLEFGLKHSDAPFVCFQNDDTIIPFANANFYSQLLHPFRDANVAAVGPATTNASGWHSIFMRSALRNPTEVSYLIFFTVMIRRSELDAVGGIDTTAPGGDDFDLSIRLRKNGKKLIINPNAFLIHHAFKTGERVRGDSSVAGGWNSQEMTDTTNKWLIQKHGFKTFFQTLCGLDYSGFTPKNQDTEGEIVRQYVQGDKVVELACGAVKTVPESVGVDRVRKGEMIPHVGKASVADVVADVSGELPFASESVDIIIARHVLEHLVDPVGAITAWSKVLKSNGKLILAVPNEDIGKTIPMNPEHVHVYTMDSLNNLMSLCGFRKIETIDTGNGVSFVGVYKKIIGTEQKGESANG